MHHSFLPEAAGRLPEPVALRDWQPQLPEGDLRSISLHWTAGDYRTVFPSYHFCISGPPAFVVHATRDVRANMRDVRAAPSGSYAAHTAGRNSYALGVAACAMQGATPHAFGDFPLVEEHVGALCRVAAILARRYGIAPSAVRTHAEAAADDGYLGAGGDDERWDLARLRPARLALSATEAYVVGEHLRRQIASGE
ncbi:MAG: hypothetical protein ABR591_03865 [Candidatus Velthaea sp.]